MKPFRKPFFGDAAFPFEMVHRATKHPQFELPDHLHDRCEIVYVHSGSGTFFIDDTLYEKKPGDLFLIPGNTIHRAFPNAADPIVSTALFFAPAFVEPTVPDDSYTPLGCFEQARRARRCRLVPPERLKARIEALIEEMHAELTAARAGYREAVRLSLGRLLLLLNRHLLPERDGAPDSRIGPAWLRESLRTIHARPEAAGSLSTLAARAGVSPAHFARVFKRHTGMSVTQYVNAKRILHAKELLRDTDDSAGAVAERCGFDSLTHFHRVFKSLTGMTPGAFRRGGRAVQAEHLNAAERPKHSGSPNITART